MICGVSARADNIGLALLLDGSGSIGTTNWLKQVNAYVSIFGSGSFYDNYVVPGDTLTVRTWEFSTTVDGLASNTSYTINDNASAAVFAAALAADSHYNAGWTYTQDAVNTAASWLTGTPPQPLDRMIIDVSTDGVPQGPGGSLLAPTLTALTNASGQGITTNFIGVGNSISPANLNAMATAGGGFYLTANNFDEFQVALENKLFHEIQNKPVPAPATLGLFALGLLGLTRLRRFARS